MKKHRLVPYLVFMILVSFGLAMSACKKDDPEPQEAKITEFVITNAGAAGNLRAEGTITDLNITVGVPYETDLTALIPDIKTSPNATVIPASGTALDFTNARNFVVTNGNLTNTYQVSVNKLDPTSPVITGIVMKSKASNETYQTSVNLAEKKVTVTLNSLQSKVVYIDQLNRLPAGTTYVTSSGNDTLDLGAATAPTITLSFGPNQTVYTLVANVTQAGFDPGKRTTLIDKSGFSNLVPTLISNENNRGAAFDGRYVFVASRQEGNHLYYWDTQNPTEDPKKLAMSDIVAGGTWLVSDIQVVGSKIYVGNMVMNEGQIFKVYMWDGVEDESPELIVEYTIPGESIRLGDAISIIGTPPANGYVFASNFAWPNNASEFYVWSFNQGKTTPTPTVLPVKSLVGNQRMGQYGRVNSIPGEPTLLLVTGAEAGIGVMDYQGNFLYESREPMIQSRSFAPTIFEYNGGRYLAYVVNREWSNTIVTQGVVTDGAYYDIINISEGGSVVDALKALNEANIASKRVVRLPVGGSASSWVGAVQSVKFGPNGKPRVMNYVLRNGFIVHEFSN